MADMMEDIAHLSQEIGPRPAGTEEEQQAALYIADELQKSAGFSTVVEDVSCASNGNTIRLITYAVAFVCTLLAVIFPILAIPCIIIDILVAALFACEILGRPILSRFLRNGVSQNVVAKYNPTSITQTNKRRKVILVTHYDSARVSTQYQGIVGKYLSIIRNVEVITLAVAPLLLLIKSIFFASDGGAASIVFNILLTICLIIFALPLAGIIKTRFSPYNEAANNDAAGVAVLLDVARTVGNGLVSANTMEERAAEAGVEIHGEDAAREAGLMDDVEVVYQAREPRGQKMTPEESLAAAKAAIAAFTGKPVADKVPLSDISARLVRHGDFFDSEEDAAAAAVHFEVEDPNEAPAFTPRAYEADVPAAEDYASAASASAGTQAQPAPSASGVHAPAAAGQDVTQGASAAAPAQPGQPGQPAAAPAAESFMRESPEALQPGSTGMESTISNVPSWAKAAQEKAHANRPDLANKSGISRSRFADAPAARMADAARNGASPSEVVAAASEDAAADGTASEPRTYTPPESELSRRLAAMRAQIDSAAAPMLKKVEEAAQEAAGIDADQLAEPIQPDTPSAMTGEINLMDIAEADAAYAEADTSYESSAPARDTYTEDAIEDDLVTVPNMEPHRPSTSDMIEQQQARSARSRRASSRRSAEKKNNIGGFLGRASSMVSNVSSKVSGLKTRGQRHDEEDLYEEDVVLVDDVEPIMDDVNGQTINMPQIDVDQVLANESTEQIPAVAATATTAPAADEANFNEDVAYADEVETVEYAQEYAEDAEGDQLFTEVTYTPEEEPAIEPVAPIIGMEAMTSALPQIQQETIETEAEDQPDRHVIVLPDVVTSVATNLEGAKQRAPMARETDAEEGAPALLSNMLPKIDPQAQAAAATTRPARPLAINLPDFNTSDFARVEGDDEKTAIFTPIPAPGTSAAFGEEVIDTPAGSAGSTGSFAEVGVDLMDETAQEPEFIEDADDSVYDEGFTETGAFAGPDYVEMPKSRLGSIFGGFGKKKKQKQQQEQSVHDWVNVDSSYEARSVGEERGSWESFRSEDGDTEMIEIDYEAADGQNNDQDRDWNGGAFSLSSLRNRVSGGPKQQEDDAVEEFDEVISVSERPLTRTAPKDAKITEVINNEMRQLRDFRHPDIDTEVWFVALGAEEALNSGMTAFIEEHQDELKGAIIINLEGLGAGQLSFIDEEGLYRPTKASSRIKRVLRQAVELSGVPFTTNKLLSRNTSAHIAAQKGFQAFTVAGMDGDQTAYYASIEDRLENIEEAALEENSSFVLGLLKSV